MLYKKSISPVVGTALLIVVAVLAVVSFQNWYQTYSSDLLVKAETSSSQTSQTGIEALIGDQLYFKNNYGENITIKQIKLSDKECNISINISTGINNINIGSCLENINLKSNIDDITIITDKNVYSKKHLFKDFNISSSQTLISPLNVSYVLGLSGDIYGQNWTLINVSANKTIQSCSLNWGGVINSSFTINQTHCFINISSNYGNLINYNVSVIANDGSQNITQTNQIIFNQDFYSCKSIFEAGKSVGDGFYNIDPDGFGGDSLFSVYCDMTNGGWMALNPSLKGYNTTITYNPPIVGFSFSTTQTYKMIQNGNFRGFQTGSHGGGIARWDYNLRQVVKDSSFELKAIGLESTIYSASRFSCLDQIVDSLVTDCSSNSCYYNTPFSSLSVTFGTGISNSDGTIASSNTTSDLYCYFYNSWWSGNDNDASEVVELWIK